LSLLVATNAVPAGGVFEVGVEAVGDAGAARLPSVAVFELVSTGENNGVPQGYKTLIRDSLGALWLTVPPPPPPPAAPAAAAP
jgi:hypothetical protein